MTIWLWGTTLAFYLVLPWLLAIGRPRRRWLLGGVTRSLLMLTIWWLIVFTLGDRLLPFPPALHLDPPFHWWRV